jgi:MFS family permease
MTNTQVGYLLATSSLLGLFVVPLWAALCDHWGGQRRVLLLCVPLSALCVAGYGLCAEGAFSWFMAVRVLHSLVDTPSLPLLDAFSLAALPSREEYGHCRLWGAVSWGIVNAAILGPLLDEVYR